MVSCSISVHIDPGLVHNESAWEGGIHPIPRSPSDSVPVTHTGHVFALILVFPMVILCGSLHLYNFFQYFNKPLPQGTSDNALGT